MSAVTYRFKVVIVGEPAVGKTSLVEKACIQKSPGPYHMTIGVNIYSYSVQIYPSPASQNKLRVTLQIWDLGGQERFTKIQPDFYNGAHAVIMCFDLNDPETLDMLKQRWWDKEIKNTIQIMAPDAVFYLVGTKADLEQKIDEKKINEFANLIGDKLALSIKTSAKTGMNVHELFQKIVEDLVKKF